MRVRHVASPSLNPARNIGHRHSYYLGRNPSLPSPFWHSVQATSPTFPSDFPKFGRFALTGPGRVNNFGVTCFVCLSRRLYEKGNNPRAFVREQHAPASPLRAFPLNDPRPRQSLDINTFFLPSEHLRVSSTPKPRFLISESTRECACQPPLCVSLQASHSTTAIS